jgi:selenocysteine-specific elongation factor
MIIGTAGHIDHGKTALVRALTGVDTDRLKDEKARGISIELGFAYLPAPEGSVLGFVDVPGHEKFIHTMLAGATGIDFALLAIAADDGVMPQTREHVAILELLGIERGLVALTKSDLVSVERGHEVMAAILDLLAPTSLAEMEIVPVSAITGEGIATLRTKLFDAARSVGIRRADGRFRLAVDRSFTLAGTGTVVTGTVLSGRVERGDRVAISPSGCIARVRSIHAQNRPADESVAGDRCALNLAGDGITKDAIARGNVVLDPDLQAPADRIDATLRLLATETKPVTQWLPVRLHHAAVDVGARVVLLSDEPLQPGAEAYVQLVLEQPIAAAAGDRFVLRDTTAQRTLGGGTLLDLRAPSRKRRTPERLAMLRACAIADPAAALVALLGRLPFLVDLSGFARDRALSSGQVDEIARSLGLVRVLAAGVEFALSPEIWSDFKRRLLAALETFHGENPDLPGIGLERLRLQLEPRLPALAFRAFLQQLVDEARIRLEGAWVRLADHEMRLLASDERTWNRIAPALTGEEQFRPPRVRDIASSLDLVEPDVRRLFKLLGRLGQVYEIAHDHFFHRSAVAQMVEIMIELAAAAETGEFTAAQFRDRTMNGRKVAIQILEFFDRHAVTLRRGDLRRINRHRLDLFRDEAGARHPAPCNFGRESSLVGRPDFKSGKGRESVLGGFDSLSLPPDTRSAR